MTTLADRAVGVLSTAAANAKADAAREAAADWCAGKLASVGTASPPDRPARPARPNLLAPKCMPRRGHGRGTAHRIALLHAIAHIELNAIDLAWDMVARFTGAGLPRAFYDDWVRVGDEEARHFLLLQARLADLGAAYGDLPAHDGLWQAAQETVDDVLARLAVVPLVLEARGLDVTPAMIARMRRYGDTATVEVLETIYHDEIGHVAIGKRWFDWVCKARGLNPADAWPKLVRRHFKGTLKPPFNEAARAAADFPAADYAARLNG